MKKSDIYEIAIKILGLYLVMTTVTSAFRDILTNYAFFSFAKDNPENMGSFNPTSVLIISVLNFVGLTIISLFLIFKTKWIVKRVCVTTDFEESINLFLDAKVIYQIAITLTGLLLIISTLPDFAYKLKDYFQKEPMQGILQITHNSARDMNFLIVYTIKILVGLFAVLLARQLATLFAKQHRINDGKE